MLLLVYNELGNASILNIVRYKHNHCVSNPKH